MHTYNDISKHSKLSDLGLCSTIFIICKWAIVGAHFKEHVTASGTYALTCLLLTESILLSMKDKTLCKTTKSD